jgi:hypothetical protein
MSAPNVEWFLLGCNADCSDVDEESNPAAQKTKSFLCHHYITCLLTRLVATANNCLSSRTPAIVGRLVFFSPVPSCIDRHL